MPAFVAWQCESPPASWEPLRTIQRGLDRKGIARSRKLRGRSRFRRDQPWARRSHSAEHQARSQCPLLSLGNANRRRLHGSRCALFNVVLIAKVLHALASCVAGPVLGAISLGLVGRTLLSTRLGRNARFCRLAMRIAAGFMGAVAHYSTWS